MKLAGDTEWSLQTPADRNNAKGFRQLKNKQEKQGGQIRLGGKSNAKKLKKQQWKKQRKIKEKALPEAGAKDMQEWECWANESAVCKANASTKWPM